MSRIAEQLDRVHERMAAACMSAGRNLSDVKLVAVSKTFPAEDIRNAVEAGQRCFGESRLQEAEPKMEGLPGGLEWHFIGRIQRNKVRKLLSLFGWIHAMDSLKLATFSDRIAGELGICPNVFLQVNQAGEESKGGFSEEGLRESIVELKALSNLRVIGLMTIPPAFGTGGDSQKWFRRLAEFRDSLERDFSIELPSLSMGMSGDFEEAVREGATHVRVGSTIFGKRSYLVDGEPG